MPFFMFCMRDVGGEHYLATFQTGKPFTHNERNWRKDGTWVRMHDRLREWNRVASERSPSPSEAIVDSQSIKSAAMVSEAVGYDAGKKVKGRKRFVTVDTLGLVLRVLITAASVGEREGGKQVLKKVKQMEPSVWRLHTIWVDAGFDGNPFMQWVMEPLPLDYTGSYTTKGKQEVCIVTQALGSRANLGLANLVSEIELHTTSYYLKPQRHLYTLL